jgi:2-polyprenyl-3-methyl-5-hydroxy-6-metoxy-1,4-benzoquinol methylase
MGFDNKWEESYADGNMLNIYPFDILVSLVYKYFKGVKNKKNIRVLDLGCGAGNNSWFLSREGFNVVGIDASSTAINFAQERFKTEGLSGDFRLMNFDDIDIIKGEFDLVIDRESLSMTEFNTVKNVTEKIQSILKPNGLFMSFFYNKDSPDFFNYGGDSDDGKTYTNIDKGSFSGSNTVSFLDKETHSSLFSKFEIIEVYNHSINPLRNMSISNSYPNGISEFITVARKSVF